MLPEYWLLLALVFATGFALIVLSHPEKQRLDSAVFGTGLLALAAALGLHIALRYQLNETQLKLLYWGRGLLLVAWLGYGYARLALPGHKQLSRLGWGLAAAGLVGLVLTYGAQLTAAQGWYAPQQPLYPQLGDLLATNRPTRWLALGLNLAGLAVALAALWRQRRLGAGALTLLALGLLAVAFLVPSSSSLRFYSLETTPPFLLFAAWRLRTSQ